MKKKTDYFKIMIGLAITTFVLMFFIMSITFCGCGTIQISDQSKTVLIKSAARAAGYLIAKEKPTYVVPAKLVCQHIVESNGVEEDVSKIVTYVSEDKFLASTLADLMSLIEIDESKIVSSEQIALIKAAASAFIEGLSCNS